jgi:hypothetical protein
MQRLHQTFPVEQRDSRSRCHPWLDYGPSKRFEGSGPRRVPGGNSHCKAMRAHLQYYSSSPLS